jgi:hypothetical protein
MQPQHVQNRAELTYACPEGCRCHNNGTECLCKAADVGLETYVECLEASPFECPSAIRFGGIYYCSCPTVVHLTKEFLA